jgi:uncharacterized membrane protein YbhN (UPF0104 family)
MRTESFQAPRAAPALAHRPRDGRPARNVDRSRERHAWRERWQRAKPYATALFLALVAFLIVRAAHEVEWREVLQAVRRLPLETLAIAAALAAASHAIYSTYDLIGRRYTGHGLGVLRTMGVGFTSYAFNLNLGSLVGAFAVRFRLYARLGLPVETTTQVLGLSLVTNWLGYLMVGGLVLALRPLPLPPEWLGGKLASYGSGAVVALGAAMLIAPAAYMVACFFAKRREWSLRGVSITLPGRALACLQLLVSALNWSLIAATIWLLLGQRIEYTTVLAVLLLAAVAGVVTHVPAGLGVLEAVFVAMLGNRLPASELLAALLCYRALYYLLPLAVASGVFIGLEAGARRTEAAG